MKTSYRCCLMSDDVCSSNLLALLFSILLYVNCTSFFILYVNKSVNSTLVIHQQPVVGGKGNASGKKHVIQALQCSRAIQKQLANIFGWHDKFPASVFRQWAEGNCKTKRVDASIPVNFDDNLSWHLCIWNHDKIQGGPVRSIVTKSAQSEKPLVQSKPVRK